MLSNSQVTMLKQFVDGVVYGATVLVLAVLLALGMGFSLGTGLIGAKYVLFGGGLLMVGFSLYFLAPKRGHKWVDEQVGDATEDEDDDDTHYSGLFGRFQQKIDSRRREDVPEPGQENTNVEVPDDVEIVEDPIELVPPLLFWDWLAEDRVPFGSRLLISGLLLIATAVIMEYVFGVGYGV